MADTPPQSLLALVDMLYATADLQEPKQAVDLGDPAQVTLLLNYLLATANATETAVRHIAKALDGLGV